MANDDEFREKVEQYIKRQLLLENMWTKLWSLLHHGCLFGAAILSAAAALVLHLEIINFITDSNRSEVATVLAALGTLLGVISAAGAFATKWRANRATRGTLQELKLELMKPTADPDKVIDELVVMWRLHNSRITDEPSRPTLSEVVAHDPRLRSQLQGEILSRGDPRGDGLPRTSE